MQECTSNLVTDFDFELLTESFVNVHEEKLFGRSYAPAKNIVGGNYLAIPGRTASRYQRRKQNPVEHLSWSCLRK